MTCTFNNERQKGALTIIKDADWPSNQAFAFTSDIPGHESFSLTDDGSGTADRVTWTVETGTYAISETLPDGWDQASATCDNGDTPGNLTLDPGETVTCTFRNEVHRGSLTLLKQTLPAGGTGFKFTLKAQLKQWGNSGTGDGFFSAPNGVAVDSLGNVYVADRQNNRIQKFDPYGTFLLNWGNSSLFNSPSGIAVDSADRVYVADSGNSRVLVFDSAGTLLDQIGGPGTGNGQFQNAFGVAIGAGGKVYVSDYLGSRIQVFNGSGDYLYQWGSNGVGQGQFRKPVGIAIDQAGNVYVTEHEGHRVQKFTSAGTYLGSWGTLGSGVGQFNAPFGITISTNGHVYISEYTGNRVQVFSLSGQYLDKLDQPFSGPWGLAIVGNEKLYVVEALGNRVQVLRPPQEITLSDDQQQTIGDLFPAEYTLTETLPADWLLDSVTCDGGSLTRNGNSFTVGLGIGEDVTCTVTNRRAAARITVDKTTSPGGGTGFPFALVGWQTKWSHNFQYPAGAAVGPDGSVYVADYDADRIQKFDANGNYLLSWGNLSMPIGLAVSQDGTVYVADSENFRIVKFDSFGNLLGGWGVGTGPSAVALDSAGNVFVSLPLIHRIAMYSSSGSLLRQWGSQGSGNGQFQYTGYITVDAEGKVYVDDVGNHRIQVFDSSGTFIRSFGTYGTGNGQFNGPQGIAIDGNGHVIVADRNNHRIQVFDSNGNFLGKWGSFGTGDAQFNEPHGIALSSSGDLYVVEFRNNRVQKFSLATATLDDGGSHTFGALKAGPYWLLEAPTEGWALASATCNSGSPVAVDGGVQLTLAADSRMSCSFANRAASARLTLVKDTTPAGGTGFGFTLSGPASPAFGAAWGSQGATNGLFYYPYGAAVTSNAVYVADTYNNRIQQLDASGGFVRKWGGIPGTADGQFNKPQDVAVGPDGSVYVADTLNHRIQKFTAAGVFVAKWGSQGTANGQFNRPQAIAVDKDGNVYVADAFNHRVQKFTADGVFIAKWGSQGSTNGKFLYPAGIAVDAYGHVFVADTDNHRVQVFTTAGAYVTKWGSNGTGDGQFNAPEGVAVDGAGHVYVIDHNALQKFDATGVFLGRWGAPGTGNGLFQLPRGLAVSADGAMILVADTDSHRLQRFNQLTATLDDDGRQVFNNLPAGRYAIGETAAANWSLDGIACNGGSVQAIDHGAILTLASADEITCTATNRGAPGRLTIIKDADRAGPTTFAFTADIPGHTAFSLTDDGGGVNDRLAVDVPPGTYHISENTPAGWTLSGATCDNGDQPDAVTVAPGQAVVCTFVNTAQGGTLTVIKDADVSGNTTFSFSTNVPGHESFVLVDDGGGVHDRRTMAVTPGTYSISEAPRAGWTLASATCDNDDAPDAVTVDPGRSVVCTFRNLRTTAAITVRKETMPAGGQDFLFRLIGPNMISLLRQWGSQGTGAGLFDQPEAVAVDSAGNIFVADRNNHRIQKFDADGVWIKSWGSLGTTNGKFNLPSGVAVDSAGNVYVADTNNHRIQKFTNDGVFLAKWGARGTGNRQFNYPEGVAVNAAGQIYVADTANHRVQRLSPTGVFQIKWGIKGSADGQFKYAEAVALDADGNVYVADRNNHRVQVFDPNGVFIAKWGGQGTVDGKFKYPEGVAVDSAGFVYVTDSTNHRVQLFDRDGRFLYAWGSLGSGDGQFNTPTGVGLDNAGRIYVADTFNHRVQVYATVMATIDGGAAWTFENLAAGNYRLIEIPAAGWSLDDVDCRGGNPQYDADGVALTLAAGQSVDCTFTNNGATGSLTIIKDAAVAGPTEFAFTSNVPGADEFTLVDDGSGENDRVTFMVDPGTYAVSELPINGWVQSGATCDNGDDPDNVSVRANQDVTCTFVNIQTPGSLTIIKQVSGTAPATPWQFTGGLGAFTLPAAGGQQMFENLTPGSYTVTETPVTGYTVAVSCSNGATGMNSVSVTLAPAEEVTCTFVNTRMEIPPQGHCDPPGANLLRNPGFEERKTAWTLTTNGVVAYAIDTTNPYECANNARLTVTTDGTNINLSQSGLVLKANTTYFIRFAAKASGGEDIELVMINSAATSINYGLNATFDATSAWQVFTVQFTTQNIADQTSTGMLRFKLGSQAVVGSVFAIDDVVLLEQ